MILVLNILLILVYSSASDATRLQMLEFNKSIKVPYSVLVVIAISKTLENDLLTARWLNESNVISLIL